VSARDIEHAALLWHAIYAQRVHLNVQRLALQKEIRSAPGRDVFLHPKYSSYSGVKDQIAATKRKERAALKVLALACKARGGQLDRADVIDVDMRLLASTTPTIESGAGAGAGS